MTYGISWQEAVERIEKDAVEQAEIEYKCYGSVYRAGEAYRSRCVSALQALDYVGVISSDEYLREFDRVSMYEQKVIWSREWAMEQEQKIIRELEEKRLAKAKKEDAA